MEDQLFIDRVLQGETDAYSMLVDRYKDMVFTLAVRIVRTAEDAEEVAQDSFMKAYKQLHTFKGGSKFSTWLYSIVYRTAVSKTRKKNLETVDVDDHVTDNYTTDADAPQAKELDQTEQSKLVKQAINRLPELDALIITLYYMEESSVKEIEEITGLSESNIKVKLHRARKRLQEELEALLQHEMEFIR